MSDEERPDADALPEAEKSIRRRPSRLLRRLLSVLLVILLLPVVLLASLCLFSRSSQGERWILFSCHVILLLLLTISIFDNKSIISNIDIVNTIMKIFLLFYYLRFFVLASSFYYLLFLYSS